MIPKKTISNFPPRLRVYPPQKALLFPFKHLNIGNKILYRSKLYGLLASSSLFNETIVKQMT